MPKDLENIKKQLPNKSRSWSKLTKSLTKTKRYRHSLIDMVMGKQ